MIYEMLLFYFICIRVLIHNMKQELNKIDNLLIYHQFFMQSWYIYLKYNIKQIILIHEHIQVNIVCNTSGYC